MYSKQIDHVAGKIRCDSLTNEQIITSIRKTQSMYECAVMVANHNGLLIRDRYITKEAWRRIAVERGLL